MILEFLFEIRFTFHQDLIDLDTLEQLERDFNADENASSDDSPVPKPAHSPPLKGG